MINELEFVGSRAVKSIGDPGVDQYSWTINGNLFVTDGLTVEKLAKLAKDTGIDLPKEIAEGELRRLIANGWIDYMSQMDRLHDFSNFDPFYLICGKPTSLSKAPLTYPHFPLSPYFLGYSERDENGKIDLINELYQRYWE